MEYIIPALRPLAVPIDSIKVDPKNAMDHPDENLEGIMASLRTYKQRKPIVVNSETKTAEAGSGTLKAALALGWSHIAVVFVKDDPNTARGYAIADNRVAQSATWNEKNLLAALEEITVEDDGLQAMFDKLEAEFSSEPTELKPIDVKAPPKMCWVLIGIPLVKYGDVADVMDKLAAIPEVIMESTFNDDTSRQDGAT